MGLAYSEQPIATAVISADPSTFLADLDTLLASVGWTSAPYLTGNLYAFASPQGLAVQVRIWDPADSNFADCCAFQWVSSSSPGPAGLIHHLRMDAAETYFVWANCCQLFIARPGVARAAGNYPTSVSGGIPWANGLTTPTSQCEEQSPASPDVTTEMWWSCGGDSGIPLFASATVADFRLSFAAERYSFCRNGVVTSEDVSEPRKAFELGPLRAPGYWYFSFENSPWHYSYGFFDNGIVWADGDPLLSEPLVLQRGDTDGDMVIYGQLWDACIGTRPMAKEATETVYESVPGRTTNWVNYMHKNVGDSPRERFYALLLLTGIAGTGVENIAY